MDKSLYLINVVTITKILKKSQWTKDLKIFEDDRIEIKMPMVSTLGGQHACYASQIELRNLDEETAPVKYTTVNNFLNIFPSTYEYLKLY